MEKCLLLTRVSTKYQDFTPQEEDLKSHAQSLGYEVVGIISTKESGFRSIEKKDGFRQVKEFFATNPDCRTLIITELSRLSRYDDVLIHCKSYFKEHKIQLIVKDIGFHLFDENGNYNFNTDLTFNLFATIASAEMQQKKDRFARAKTVLRENGYVVGGRTLFGYNLVEVVGDRKTLEINEEEAEQIRQVFELYLQGKSINKIKIECIAKGFSKYLQSSSNIQKCLRESAYIGKKTTHNRRKNYQFFELGRTDVDKYVVSSYTYTHYPRIVNEDIFNRVQELLTTNCPEKSSRHISILGKLLYVAECNLALTAEVKKKDSAYACKRECKLGNICGKKRYSTSRDLLDCVVWSYVKDNAELIEQEQLRNLNTESIAQLEQEIANIEAKITEQEEAKSKEANMYRIEAITFSELENRVSSIKREIDSLKSAIKHKRAEIDSINDFLANSLVEHVADVICSAEGNPAEMKKHINRFISKIVVHLSDRYYSVLEVFPKKFMGGYSEQRISIPIIDEDEEGNIIEGGYEEMQIDKMSFESTNSDYIIIDKKRKIAFGVDNTVLSDAVVYNRENHTFVYVNNYSWDVPLSTENLIGLYLMSLNEKMGKEMQKHINIHFKTLNYKQS